jgi:hypothetical protein
MSIRQMIVRCAAAISLWSAILVGVSLVLPQTVSAQSAKSKTDVDFEVIQMILKRFGYEVKDKRGIYGPGTSLAIKEFVADYKKVNRDKKISGPKDIARAIFSSAALCLFDEDKDKDLAKKNRELCSDFARAQKHNTGVQPEFGDVDLAIVELRKCESPAISREFFTELMAHEVKEKRLFNWRLAFSLIPKNIIDMLEKDTPFSDAKDLTYCVFLRKMPDKNLIGLMLLFDHAGGATLQMEKYLSVQ